MLAFHIDSIVVPSQQSGVVKMAPFVRFAIKSDYVTTTVVTADPVKMYSFPDNVRLFHIKFLNGIEILFIKRGYEFYVFDKHLMPPDMSFDLAFIVKKLSPDCAEFWVDYVTHTAHHRMGLLLVHQDGTVSYNGEKVNVDISKRMYAKAKMLKVRCFDL